MVSRAKLYAQLDSLEGVLTERLVPHLERAAEGKNDLIFCVGDFNPFPELQDKTDEQTEELIVLASKILGLKHKLGESSDGSVAERICWYCTEWSNKADGHRKSAQSLAARFVEEIKIGGPKA